MRTVVATRITSPSVPARSGSPSTLRVRSFAHLRKYKYNVTMLDSNIQQMAGLLKALGEVNRLSLVSQLCDCSTPQNAMCLCGCCSVDPSGVSRHLKVLMNERILSVEKCGRERTYSLNRAYVAGQLRALADQIDSNQEAS